jgi:hypothetical protein
VCVDPKQPRFVPAVRHKQYGCLKEGHDMYDQSWCAEPRLLTTESCPSGYAGVLHDSDGRGWCVRVGE